jgi:hypothetical protein
MPELAEVLRFRARRTSVASCALALMLMGFGVHGCAASKGSSSSGTTGDGDEGDGDDGDGDEGDGDDGDGDEGDGDKGDGDKGDGDTETVPSFTYEDGDATGAFRDPKLGDDVKDHFSGDTSSSDAPELVYPLADSMHPNNLGKIEFQWKRGGSDNTEFRIETKSGSKNYRFYVPCDDSECRYQMPSNEWLALGKAFAGDTFKVTIAGSSGKDSKVALSDETTMHFSPQGVFGALYYWAAEQPRSSAPTWAPTRPRRSSSPTRPPTSTTAWAAIA